MLVFDEGHQITEIAKIPGVDILFVGPFDLGNNIGRPILDGVMHEELKAAIGHVLDVAKKNKKSAGIYSTSGDQARTFADQGFDMVCKYFHQYPRTIVDIA